MWQWLTRLPNDNRLSWRFRAFLIHRIRLHDEGSPEPKDEAGNYSHWQGLRELDEWATKITGAHYMGVAHRLHVPLPDRAQFWEEDLYVPNRRYLNDAGIDDLRHRIRAERRDRYKLLGWVVGALLSGAVLNELGKRLVVLIGRIF